MIGNPKHFEAFVGRINADSTMRIGESLLHTITQSDRG